MRVVAIDARKIFPFDPWFPRVKSETYIRVSHSDTIVFAKKEWNAKDVNEDAISVRTKETRGKLSWQN